MEHGQIFHVTRIGKYYSKNMKYRIKIYMSLRMSIIVYGKPIQKNVC